MAGGDSTADFAQFSRALERAGEDIKREVGALIPLAAETMAQTASARYPVGPTTKTRTGGRLKAGTRIRTLPGQDPLLPLRRVIAPNLAYIWQDGTAERFDPTRGNARRGRMPAADPGFWERTAVQVRAAMMQQAQAILDRPRVIE